MKLFRTLTLIKYIKISQHYKLFYIPLLTLIFEHNTISVLYLCLYYCTVRFNYTINFWQKRGYSLYSLNSMQSSFLHILIIFGIINSNNMFLEFHDNFYPFLYDNLVYYKNTDVHFFWS